MKRPLKKPADTWAAMMQRWKARLDYEEALERVRTETEAIFTHYRQKGDHCNGTGTAPTATATGTTQA